ncbi:hypothetical protein pb186bvf_005165 [Paramecium bursaria]
MIFTKIIESIIDNIDNQSDQAVSFKDFQCLRSAFLLIQNTDNLILSLIFFLYELFIYLIRNKNKKKIEYKLIQTEKWVQIYIYLGFESSNII